MTSTILENLPQIITRWPFDYGRNRPNQACYATKTSNSHRRLCRPLLLLAGDLQFMF
ncbi:hypothetical protein BANRA_05611 [Klebsiella pneumoniae]|nr:hypothetical protein BANRA_05611 [Klebsiella pneumoniae]